MIQLSRESRKMEHISLALQQATNQQTGFADVVLLHNPISELNYNDLSLDSNIGGLHTSSPLFINAMTGGARDTARINQELAIVAHQLRLPMAVGSQMAAIKNPSLQETYTIVRKENPNGIILANLGQEATVDEAKRAVEMIHADALQIHLNVMQELIMPEGDRDFSGTLHRISEIADQIAVPLIIKEVGFGMTMAAIRKLTEIGVHIIDVGGKGGTNFAKIENQRAGNPYPFLNDWGITTVASLLEAHMIKNVQLIGSGGVQNGLDIVKCLVLGASLVGMAGPILRQLHSSGIDGAINFIQDIHHQIRLIMIATGADTIGAVQQLPLVIKGETKEWCEARGIEIAELATR